MTRPAIRGAIAAAAFAASACTAILGVRDLTYDEHAGSGDGGGGDGGGGDAGGGDARSDASACGADLATDKNNCGRCGRSCLGAACASGRCDAILVSGNLQNPDSLALDGPKAYLTTAGVNGQVLVVDKQTGGAPQELARGQRYANGVIPNGGAVVWANGDYAFDDAGATGGVWTCTPPTCTPQLLAPIGDAQNPHLAGGFLYLADQYDSTIVRMLPDGGGLTTLATSTYYPFALAVDATHVYWTSSDANFRRVGLDGGAPENVGPLNAKTPGFVVLDDTNVYWAYTAMGTLEGVVASKPKANLSAAPTKYGSANVNPVGIAIDATYVYWSNEGTWTDDTQTVSKSDGSIVACPKSGCGASGPIVLADKLKDPYAIAVDDAAVYWIEYGNRGEVSGALKKVAKP